MQWRADLRGEILRYLLKVYRRFLPGGGKPAPLSSLAAQETFIKVTL
jgi:hypothetical protein